MGGSNRKETPRGRKYFGRSRSALKRLMDFLAIRGQNRDRGSKKKGPGRGPNLPGSGKGTCSGSFSGRIHGRGTVEKTKESVQRGRSKSKVITAVRGEGKEAYELRIREPTGRHKKQKPTQAPVQGRPSKDTAELTSIRCGQNRAKQCPITRRRTKRENKHGNQAGSQQERRKKASKKRGAREKRGGGWMGTTRSGFHGVAIWKDQGGDE